MSSGKSTFLYLIEKLKLDPTVRGANGRNAFLAAAARGNLFILEYLDKLNPELKHARDDYNQSSLMLAIRYADLSSAIYLIENLGMDLNSCPNVYRMAAYYRKIEILKYSNTKLPHNAIDHAILNKTYLYKTSDTELSNQKESALRLASRFSEYHTVKFMIEKMSFSDSEVDFYGRDSYLSAKAKRNYHVLHYLNSIDPRLKESRDVEP